MALSSMKIAMRDGLARFSRSLPAFRGKARIGERFQRALTDYANEDECVATVRMKNGSLLRVDLRSCTERSAFWTGLYDHEIIARLCRCLRPGSVVLDVGANIGFWSVALGRTLSKLGGILYSLEPVPSNYARLIENIALNDLGGLVRPLNVAVGESEGVVELSMGVGDATSATGNAVVLGGRVTGLPAASARIGRLDDIVVEQGITACDMIKVDIEGGEFGFLKGGLSFIGKTRPLIYLELNYYWMEQFGWSLPDLNQLASSIGYTVFREVRGDFFPADRAGTGIENALMVPIGGSLGDHARQQLWLP